jgi:hypothetical protein
MELRDTLCELKSKRELILIDCCYIIILFIVYTEK